MNMFPGGANPHRDADEYLLFFITPLVRSLSHPTPQ